MFSGKGKFSSFGDHNFETIYRSGIIHCPVPNFNQSYAVFRLYYRRHFIDFPALAHYSGAPRPMTFAHCSSPLFGNRYKALDFVEFLEYYLALGVNRFLFYVEEVPDAEIMQALEYYRKKGVVEIRNWTLPISGKLHEHGQVLALNDCFMRTAHIADYSINGRFEREMGQNVQNVYGQVDGMYSLQSSWKRNDFGHLMMLFMICRNTI